MLSIVVAALVASAQAGSVQEISSGVVQDCALTTSRSRALLGYFGLSGEGATEAFVRASHASTNSMTFTENVGDGAGEAIGYSRIRTEFIPCQTAKDRNYHQESRGWLSRMFVGLKAEKTLTVRVSVEPDNVSKDSVLTRTTRLSSKSGDEWATQINDSDILLPYFRIGQSTVIRVAPSFVASSDYSSSVASDIIDLAERAAALINPAATLITSENKNRFTKATNFVDATVNGLLHRRIGEEAVSARVPRDLQAGGEIARILLLVPGANTTVNSSSVQPIGVWIVRADPMIRSLFGKQNADGRLIGSTLSAPTILGFTVVEGKTLRETLLAKSGVSASRDAYLQANDDSGRAKNGAEFCNAVSLEAATLGLSRADVGAAVWAMASDLAPEASVRAQLLNSCATADQMPI